jgi:molybdopterin synthase catalytic subunit
MSSGAVLTNGPPEPYDWGMRPAPDGEDWVALTDEEITLDEAARWVARPDCGAVVAFAGNVRDHAEGRPGVSLLEYEAYAEAVVPRLTRLTAEAHARWPGIGRIVCWHRVGILAVGDCAVVVATSAGHRAEAFDAARWCIDTIKATMPIWKRETWDGGEDWGTDAHGIAEVGS